jgi:hypothetical protein
MDVDDTLMQNESSETEIKLILSCQHQLNHLAKSLNTMLARYTTNLK